jgi:hypothetical protein
MVKIGLTLDPIHDERYISVQWAGVFRSGGEVMVDKPLLPRDD